MKKKEQENIQNQVMEGFNPRVYRSLSFLFTVLTILNVIVIVYAFARTGYGLWHAEDALSYIAKIDSNFGDINQSVLKIQIYSDDKTVVANNIDRINDYHQGILVNSQAFSEINLSNIDKSLPVDFTAAMNKIEQYYNSISGQLNEIKKGSVDPAVLQDAESELLRENAKVAIDQMFEKQDKATYLFFCRVGQSFLFVLLFLVLTLSAGLYAIFRIKKHDYDFAMKLQSSKEKTANIRQKAVEIAYTNVVTGLRNRYALDDMLDERLKKEDVTVALYDFSNFKGLNEQYGRDFGDEFISVVSQKIVESFGNQSEIFSTEVDEFFVVFDKNLPKSRVNSISHRILHILSEQYLIRGATIQMNVAGCLCFCKANTYPSADLLFKAMDQSMNHTKSQCMQQNRSLLLPLQ
ncbi:MAG: GGDEF domain-containing protein [Oscillospiraceae bacterium]|nr:GGDEF domain-containing protein [Oscillospiraceae bacterium]MCR4760021.1 GGDEF domain-containing protein [Oscillospiraceae bacterium]